MISSCGGTPALGTGERCYGNDECASGLCEGGACQEACTSNADCVGGVCAGQAFSTGGLFCTADCGDPLASGWYCASGVPTRCEAGGAEADCLSCGCPSGQFCDFVTNACGAPREVGEPCSDHSQCVSRNCGRAASDARICFVAEGAPCDGTNCGECVTHSDGSSECLQACDDSGTCGGEEDDMLCWGSVASDEGFYCRTPCSEFDPSSCPDGYTCRMLRDRDFRYYHRCYPDNVTVGSASYGCESGGVADNCGVCDDDPSNDCVQDCAGRWGGAATTDMCGTCDADASNDCVQDCAGTWGGPATVDPCGTCDADPDNDGNVDPCGVCDTDPTNDCVPVCRFGESLLGGCWFVSDTGTDCVSECSTRGGRYSEQTRRVAGSDGSLASCRAIIEAWQPSVASVGSGFGQGGIGCAMRRPAVFGDPTFGYRHADVETTASADARDYARLCACEF